MESREEYDLSLIDNNIRQPQYMLKGKNEKGISFSKLRSLGVYITVEKHDRDSYDDCIDWRKESWYAMTDGQYGDMPDGFDGNYNELGF